MDQPASLFEPPPDLLAMQVKKQTLRAFFPLLQSGFAFGALVGCSIRQLLCDQLGLDEAYVTHRISTIFLDGKPVDDIDGVLVHDGSVLSLSAAMPGLVGAAMRMGGRYAQLRDSITAREKSDRPLERPGLVRMKLFNMVMEELGPDFLRRGIVLRVEELRGFFREQPKAFWDAVVKVTLNGATVAPRLLIAGAPLRSQLMMLSVIETEEH